MNSIKYVMLGLLMPVFLYGDDGERVSFSFRAITWSDKPLIGLELSGQENGIVISAPIDRRSESYQYTGDRSIELLQTEVDESDKIMGAIEANPEWSEVLFFLLPNANRSQVKVLALDDSLSAFPANTVRLLNLSGKTIAGFLGNQKIMLENMADQKVEMNKTDEFMPIRFAKGSDSEGGWARFLSSAIEVCSGMRTLIIFYPGMNDDLRRGSDVTYKLFNDNPEVSS